MLQVGLAHQQGDLHIGDGGTCQHTPVDLFAEVGDDELLILQIQHIGGADRIEDQTGASRQRLQQQVALGVMPQGLKVAHALHRVGDGLLVENPPVLQGHIQIKPLLHQRPENFQLDLAHDLHMDLASLLQEVKLGVFLLQLPQLGPHHRRVCPLGQGHPVGHDGLQHRRQSFRLRTQGLAHEGFGKARDRRQLSGGDFLWGGEFFTGVAPQLQHLFFCLATLLVYITQNGTDLQASAGDLQPGQPVSLGIPGDFINSGGKHIGIYCLRCIYIQQVQQVLHPLQLQGGAEAAGKQLPFGDQAPEISLRYLTGFQIIFQQCLIAHSGSFGDCLSILTEVHTAGGQLPLQLCHQRLPFRTRQVHLVDEEEGGDAVPLQQPPEGDGVGLNAVGAGDHQHRAVQNAHDPLGLGRKIHMAGGIHNGHIPIGCFQQGLLGENGDAPCPLQIVGVKIRIPVIHPAQGPSCTGNIQQGFAQCGLARVHMGQQTSTNMFLFELFTHGQSLISS